MRASLCGVALVTLVAGCANPASDTPFIAPSRIITVSGDLTFGQVMVGQSLQLQTLLISNAGTTALGVTSLTFPCSSMFGATPLPLTIHANGTSGVGVTFSPTAVQDCSGQVQVNGNQMSGKNTIAVDRVRRQHRHSDFFDERRRQRGVRPSALRPERADGFHVRGRYGDGRRGHESVPGAHQLQHSWPASWPVTMESGLERQARTERPRRERIRPGTGRE